MLATAVERSHLLERALPRVRPLIRHRYPILIVAAFAFAIPNLGRGNTDWVWFTVGTKVLFRELTGGGLGEGGFDLYADNPAIQIGPLALLLARGFRLFGDGRVAAVLTMTAAAPYIVYVVERTARRVAAPTSEARDAMFGLTVLVGGFLFVEGWTQVVAIFTHVDDALVLTFAAIGAWAVATRRTALVGVALGLAIAAKPWAVVAVPLILGLRARDWWKAAAIGGGLAVAAWLPFIVADTETISAIRPYAVTSPASIVHLFGLGLDSSPAWLRPVQLLGAIVAGAIAVWRGRWSAVLAVGIAVRLLLDPNVYTYYTGGLLLGALVWDLTRSDVPTPFWTIAVFWTLDVTTMLNLTETTEAVLRLLLIVALLATVLGRPRQPAETAIGRAAR